MPAAPQPLVGLRYDKKGRGPSARPALSPLQQLIKPQHVSKASKTLSVSSRCILQSALNNGKFLAKQAFITCSSPVWVPAKLSLVIVEKALMIIEVIGNNDEVRIPEQA